MKKRPASKIEGPWDIIYPDCLPLFDLAHNKNEMNERFSIAYFNSLVQRLKDPHTAKGKRVLDRAETLDLVKSFVLHKVVKKFDACFQDIWIYRQHLYRAN